MTKKIQETTNFEEINVLTLTSNNETIKLEFDEKKVTMSQINDLLTKDKYNLESIEQLE